jgi:hypothetical protein
MPDSQALRLLVESLGLLAADAPTQLSHLVGLGLGADDNMEVNELALEFEDALATVPGLVWAGLVTQDAESKLQALDARLRSISGGREKLDLWTPPALRGAPEWAEIRRLATDALEAISADPAP